MTEAERIARIVRDALPLVKRGALRFWGAWFGRPYDNLHEIVGCQAEGDLLTVHFNEGELLRVWAPLGATVDADAFRIGDAKRVRWEWFYYGRPQIPANIYFEDFTVEGPETRSETNVDWHLPDLQTDRSLPAVEIL